MSLKEGEVDLSEYYEAHEFKPKIKMCTDKSFLGTPQYSIRKQE